jgi:hypothetical protein
VLNLNVGNVHEDEWAWCPKCGSSESHPTDPDLILIRGNKVYDDFGCWSQCLVCAGEYDENLKPLNKPRSELTGGWFCED